jgi:hypothetical protein
LKDIDEFLVVPSIDDFAHRGAIASAFALSLESDWRDKDDNS